MTIKAVLKSINRIAVPVLIALLCLSHPISAQVDLVRLISSIRIDGLRHVTTNQLPQVTDLENRSGKRVDEAKLARDIDALFLTGYFQSVNAHTVVSNNQLVLVFDVDENPVINQVQVSGNRVMKTHEVLRIIGITKGDILNIRHLKEAREALNSRYQDMGYTFAKVKNMEFVNGSLNVEITEGEIESVKLIGLKTLQPSIILREIDSKKGKAFNIFKIRKDRARLLRLGYFAEVSSPTIIDNEDQSKLTLVFDLKEKKVNRIDLGIETDRERTVTFIKSVNNHFFLQSDLLSGKVQFGSENGSEVRVLSYSASYTQPWILNWIPISFRIDGWDEVRRDRLSDRSDEFFDNRRTGGDIILGLELIRDTLYSSMKYKVESVTFLDEPPSGKNVGDYQIRSLTAALELSTVERPDNPLGGMYWNVELEKGNNVGFIQLGGLDFYRLSSNLAAFYRPTDELSFGVRVSPGIFRPDNDDFLTFETEGFELGGANSLRGYHESQFIGNRRFLINVEGRYDLNDVVQMALFLDMGRTFDSGFDIGISKLEKGVGVGFRFFTPLGPIRTDFGWETSQFMRLDAMMLHISFGQLF